MVQRVEVSLMVEGVGFESYWCIKGTGIRCGYQGKGVGGVVELRMQGAGSFVRVKGREGVLQWLIEQRLL